MGKQTTTQFIDKAREIHKDKYDYSKVDYINAYTKICIICPIHGEFWQTPHSHLRGSGCPKCSGNIKPTTIQFIEKAREIHKDKYDYSKVEYINSKVKVCIICPIHGEFWQTPEKHLLRRQGCPKCANKNVTTEEFIAKAKEIHGNKYNYSKSEYKGSKNKICIICPMHGEFWQSPGAHLRGRGCPICNQSHLEREIQQELEKNEIEFEYNKYYDFLDNLQLDFFIPSKNIAIECQGRQHFEQVGCFDGEQGFNICIKNDKKKQKLCGQKGIKLLYYSNLGIEYPYKVYENKEELIELIQKNETNN